MSEEKEEIVDETEGIIRLSTVYIIICYIVGLILLTAAFNSAIPIGIGLIILAIVCAINTGLIHVKRNN